LRNWAQFPVDPASLSAVVLTHAHLDHSGYLPLLVRNGFRGPIYATAATIELCRILLPDSGHIQEEDADFANRHGFSKHHPALPLYTQADAERCLAQFKPLAYDVDFSLGGSWSVRLMPSGHILGSAFIALNDGHSTLLFSGDLGRPNDMIMLPPRNVEHADWLVVESTYGDRVHASTNVLDELAAAVTRTLHRGGIVLVPAFAVARTQSLLYALHLLKRAGRIPATLRVFLDSPMATNVTGLYRDFASEHRLDHAECQAMCEGTTFVNSVDQSKEIDTHPRPMVLIAASGMATGGRVLHHLKAFASDPRNLILFSGYQAAGTRGASIVSGADHVRIHGQDVPIRAEVAMLSMLSAHANSNETIEWLKHFRTPPRRTFVTHGEPAAADALRRRIAQELHWNVEVPDYLQRTELAP
jgi:metallo-beta-lactamase family protein